MRKWLHSLLTLEQGSTVLDLGCGKAQDLRLLAENNPQVSHFIGVDSMEDKTGEAKENCLDPRLEFQCADISKGLPFDDQSIDTIYSVNMLECITNKQALLEECARVLKPGGQILMAHYDWDTQTFDGADRALVRKIVQTFNDWKQAWMSDIDPWIGRRLWRYMQGSGLFDGEVHTYTLTNTNYEDPYFGWMWANSFDALVRRDMISAEEHKSFMDELQRLSDNGQYFYSITMFAYLGRKSNALL